MTELTGIDCLNPRDCEKNTIDTLCELLELDDQEHNELLTELFDEFKELL